MAHEILVVRIAQNGEVDRDSVTLSLEKNQRLVWVSDADVDYDVEFTEDSPFGFNRKSFAVPANECCDPGPITTNVEKSYHYGTRAAVALKGEEVMAGVWQPDPEIIVTN